MNALDIVAPVLVLIVGALVLALLENPSLRRGFALLVAGVAAGLFALGLGDPALDAGFRVLGGFIEVDRIARAGSLLVAIGIFGAIAMTPARPSAIPREAIVLSGGLGGIVALHAGDFLVVWLGLELLALSAIVHLVADRPNDDAIERLLPSTLLVAALSLVAIMLLYGGLSTTRFEGLAARTSTVFTHWGAMQRYVVLFDGSDPIPPGLRAQAAGKIVRGLAPAAMFLAGLLLWLATLLARAGLVPFPSVPRRLLERASPDSIALQTIIMPAVILLVMLRVFIGSFHAPRLVGEPYGWTGPVLVLALATALVCALVAVRTRDLVTLVVTAVRIVVAELVLVLVVAATYHGQRSTVEGGKDWLRALGDEGAAAVALGVAVLVIAGIGALSAASCITRDRGFMDVHGFARRHPGVLVSLLVCLSTLAGVPLTAGFLSHALGLRLLVHHGSLAWTVVPLALALLTVAVRGASIFARASSPADPREVPPPPKSARFVAAAFALVCLATGLLADPAIRAARTSTAGLTLGLGSEERADWVRRPRSGPPSPLPHDRRR